MFDHEIMSKKHVKEHEFDGLYGVQKSLMTSGSKYLRRELFPTKRTFEESQLVGSTRSLLVDQDFRSIYQHRQLDLQTSTGNFCNDDVSDEEDAKLSLSIGTSTNKRSRTSEKSWKNKIMYSSSHDTVYLGESTVTGWNEDAYKFFSLDRSSQSSTDYLNKVVNLQQDHLKIDPPCKKKEFMVNDGVCQELSSITQGSNGLHDVKPKVLLDFDLNEPQPDEYYFHSNGPLGTYPSSDGSSSDACSQIATPLTLKSQTEVSTINLESHPEPSSDLTEEEEEIHISDDLNIAAQKAALSLVSISKQQPSTSDQDSETELGSNETEKNSNENNKELFKRTCSIDSYEALCLKLEPSNVDEDCATSKAYEIKEFDEKKSGIKLKRGRRLKDFQRDILPTLSSLTRCEILEDINLLEGVLRSREYQKYNKAKTSKGENWFTPVKSKRSKANYTGSNKKREL
ncbi:hypothetical protein CTI12_AA331630 [Artemisia annua]|uniref:Uncharacterized protein n=1 Tax=Artemisia annua TaxID=35608 RepID=A0A2U1MX82_ARTAN|nr:hypothetical protein CTI12_AA331630 [Artemisia annua]